MALIGHIVIVVGQSITYQGLHAYLVIKIVVYIMHNSSLFNLKINVKGFNLNHFFFQRIKNIPKSSNDLIMSCVFKYIL